MGRTAFASPFGLKQAPGLPPFKPSTPPHPGIILETKIRIKEELLGFALFYPTYEAVIWFDCLFVLRILIDCIRIVQH